MNKKKILSLIMALVMIVGVFSPLTALANNGNIPEEPVPEGKGWLAKDYTSDEITANISTKKEAKTLTVDLHKMLMTKENIKARKVTVYIYNNTSVATEEQKKNEKDKIKAVTKVIVFKDGKYINAKNNSELNSENTLDKAYIDGFNSGVPVFPGWTGLDHTEESEDKYIGEAINNLKNYFGEPGTQMENVFFAWQVKGQETDASGNQQYIKAKTKVVNGKTEVEKDANGAIVPDLEPTKDAEQKIIGYKVKFTTNLDEAFGGLTTKNGIKFDTSKLKGTFLIQEVKEKSKYQNDGKSIVDQRAVPVDITLPLINEKGTILNAHVYPKNVEDKPEIDKNFVRRHGLAEALKKTEDPNKTLNEGAKYENYEKEKAKVTADVGRVIPYEVKTKIAKGTAYERLIWNDSMTNGLTYNKDLGTSKTYKDLLVKDENNQEATKDVVTGIKVYKKEAGAEINNPKYVDDTTTPNEPKKIKADVEVTLDAGDYTITEDDKGFRLMFTDAGLEKVSKITKPADVNGVAQEAYDVEVVLTYTATVNGSTKVDNPEKNNITLEYGHKKGKDIEKKDVKPSNKEINVDKSFDPALDEAAKKDLVLSYTLKEGETVVGTVTLTKDDAVGTIFDLGNGVKFEVTGEFAGKFTGLDDKKTYSFYERVAGYNPVYTNTDAAGTVIITNKKDNDNPPPLNPTEPKVVTGGKKFVKTNDKEKNDKDLKRLLGAQFVVKKEVGEKTYYLVSKADTTKANDQKALLAAEKAYRDAIDAYNEAIKKATGANTAEKEANVTINLPKPTKADPNATEEIKGKTNIENKIAELRVAYEAAFKTAGTLYDWITLEKAKENNSNVKESKDIPNVVKISSDAEGRFEIQGLAYGSYSLEEIKTPEGFAKISDQPFTVAEGSYQGARGELMYYPNEADTPDLNAHGYGQQVKNKEVTIPQTGGIGTVLFTVVGVGLMAGAVMAMKKNREEA